MQMELYPTPPGKDSREWLAEQMETYMKECVRLKTEKELLEHRLETEKELQKHQLKIGLRQRWIDRLWGFFSGVGITVLTWWLSTL